MMITVLPTGSFHGWGVCGKYIVKELSKITDVRLLTSGLEFNNIQDEFDFRLLQGLVLSEEDAALIRGGSPVQIRDPVLQNILDKSLRPAYPNFRGSVTAGYTFFEDNILDPSFIENGRRHFDVIVTGSTWCEDVLREHGLDQVTTIIQGVDPTIFNPTHAVKEYLQDRFVIFSGGKFELRKGQDLVLRAFKILQDAHPDVMLVTSWYNHWAASMQTMTASPHIRFEPVDGSYADLMMRTLSLNGIDPAGVMVLPPYPNVMMTRIYRNTDIGVFPNRCEGGTNLVMMEYMACGKPVIASLSSGHKDVLTEANSIPLRQLRPITISDRTGPIATWDEPDLDELVARLEEAYRDRAHLRAIGARAGEDLAQLTWGVTAQRFHAVLTRQGVAAPLMV